ncbi:hypothetical protein ACHAWF_012787 [Thalassiosira exigua]
MTSTRPVQAVQDSLLVEDVRERLEAMRARESSPCYVVPDYLARDEAEAAEHAFWRQKICEWCYQVVDHSDLDREVVASAASCLDRYLASLLVERSKPAVDRRVLQLSAMTALYLSAKIHERRKLRPSALAGLSKGCFSSEDVVAAEGEMLRALQWRVHPVTGVAFVRELSRLLPSMSRSDSSTSQLARFLAELAVCDYWLATRRPSSVALASILVALERTRGRAPATEFVGSLERSGVDFKYQDEEVAACRERLSELYVVSGFEDDFEGEQDEEKEGCIASPAGVMDGPDASGEDQGRGDNNDMS